jgi:hypothetical protein
MTKTWLAGVVAAVLLVGGGVGGYFIGATNDNDNGRPGWHQQFGPGDGFRGNAPDRGNNAPNQNGPGH